jgi:hypothetical protein
VKVICAGFGRTGTSSLKGALERLLGGPCFHFEELFKHKHLRRAWAELARGGPEPDWPALYEGYQAVVDFPSCAYWEELADAFPDALILLSVREPESWARSWMGLWRYLKIFRLLRFLPFVNDIVVVLDRVIAERTFGGQMNKEALIEAFQTHNERVKATVPSERLRVYRVQEGWAPLCEALGVPVPDVPFPRYNPGNAPMIRRMLARLFGGRWKSVTED